MTLGRRFLWMSILLAVSALPIFRDDFLFSDDYYWFDIQHSRPFAAEREATQMNISNGRPLHNIAFIAMHPLLAERSGWLVARGLGVLVLIGCMALLSKVLRRRFDDERADWLALLIMLLPGFVLFAFWLIGVPCLIADAAAIAAFALVLRGRVVVPVALMVAALSAYQPHAMLFFALVAFWLAYTDDLSWRSVARPFAVGLGAMVIYFPFAHLLVKLYDYGVPGRGEVVIEPVKKLLWLGRDALPFSAKMWSIVAPEHVALALLCGVFATAAIFGRHRLNLKRIALVVAALVLTMLPHLVVRETVIRWRVVLPLSVGLVLVWAVLARFDRWPKPAFIALTLCALLLRTYELETYGVAPERAQIAAAASALHGQKRAFVVRPTIDDPICVTRVSNDEFTAPSSQHDFAAAGIVRTASLVAGLPMPELVLHDNDIGRAPKDAAVLDLRHMPCGQKTKLSSRVVAH